MVWPTTKVSSWEEFRDLAESCSIGVGPIATYAFRGQANVEWGLNPSLHRVLRPLPDPKVALFIEAVLTGQFSESAGNYLPPNLVPTDEHGGMAWWPIMQHWGAQTRLLDWTRSPFVAAYFAVNDNQIHDGVVWMFKGLPFIEGMGVLHSDYSTKQYKADKYLDESAPTDLVVQHNKFSDERMASQQATFTVSRNIMTLPDVAIDAAMNAVGHLGDNDYYVKVVIAHELKVEFLKRLSDMNITSTSLFPDLDGLGKGLFDLAKMLVRHHESVAPLID